MCSRSDSGYKDREEETRNFSGGQFGSLERGWDKGGNIIRQRKDKESNFQQS